MNLFNSLLITEVEIDFAKQFHEANFFISIISSGSKFILQIRMAHAARLRIQLNL